MAQGIFNLKQVNQAILQNAWSGFIAPKFVEYLVVAGGGSGATLSTNNNYCGGGGAGGLLTGIVPVVAGNSYTVTVGGGGASGSSGTNSVFGSLTAIAGGRGGGFDSPFTAATAGASGGSGGGGGGAYYGGAGGQGTAGQGNAGAYGYDDNPAVAQPAAGGGGGAGSVGLTAFYGGSSPATFANGGRGGSGIASAISGTTVIYAGGGGGGTGFHGSGGLGGVGGGGDGGTQTVSGKNANVNTGSGGGGAGGSNTGATAGGIGGSGIVIVRYPGSVQFYTGGAVTYANGYVVHKFYVTDTLAPTAPTALATSEYQISRSLRFNSADSAYLNRTPASAGNRRTWTWSGWVKRGSVDANYRSFFSNGNAVDSVMFWNDNSFAVRNFNGSSYDLITTQVFRDPSAWYHLVIAMDTTQATSSNRIKIYVNGVQVTAFATASYPSQNYDTGFNTTTVQYLGYNEYNYFNGYMTEVNFIDGQALTPSSFGETNSNTGVWQPKAYTGTYGTNGFYLNFSDNSNTTAATLGKDYSGNGNNWTPNNFSVTAGAGNDSLVDSPTSYGTDTGVGGEVRGNYATLNPISLAGGTFTNGNLDWASPTTDGRFCLATIPVNFMNCYCEVTIGSATSLQQVGVYGNPTTFNPRVQYRSDGQASIDGVAQATYATFTTNDIIGIAYNSSTGSTSFYKNGTLQGSMTATSATVTQYFAAGSNSSGAAANYTFNFGQRPFAYTAPSGFKALCTTNLPAPTIGSSPTSLASKFFNTVLWTGDGSQTRSITGVGFQPDFTWMKIRADTPQDHQLYDAVRGAGGGKNLSTNTTAAEGTVNSFLDSDYGYLSSFDSDGFSVNDGAVATTGGYVNYSGRTYVAWNWKASNATAVTNTSGSLTSSVRANPVAGFSVVTYTGNAASAQTIGHGLGVAPSMIIVGARGGGNWPVYHKSGGVNQYVFLNSTAAFNTVTGYWGTASPTSTVFGVIGGGYSNNSGTAVAYCFAEVAGYSAFGSYTGNGSTDGTFVYFGFRPAYVMIKASSAVDNWVIMDVARNPTNAVNYWLQAESSVAEATLTPPQFDFVSNGLKLRGTSSTCNGSGVTYIYMAFAQNPFKYSLAR